MDHGQWTDVYEPALGIIWDIQASVAPGPALTASVPLPPDLPPPVATPTKPSYRINYDKGALAATFTGAPATAAWSYDYARPSSYHIGGVNVAYCDGHVGFLSEQMEYFVYCLLMSPDGHNVKIPGDTKPLSHKSFGCQLDDNWLLHSRTATRGEAKRGSRPTIRK